MSEEHQGLLHEELTRQTIGVFYEVYTELLGMDSLNRCMKRRWKSR